MEFITTFNINEQNIQVWAEPSKIDFADYGKYFLFINNECINKDAPFLTRPNRRIITMFLEDNK